MIEGFRLTFDDGTEFRATEDVFITHETEPLYAIDGLSNLVAIFNEYADSGGQPGAADSNFAGAFAGFGAGVHIIQLDFVQFKTTSDNWGDATPASDGPITLLQTLNRAITTIKADSDAPATLEVSEYSSGGKYDPLPVAMGPSSLSFDPNEESAAFNGQVTFYEAVSLNQAIDAATSRFG